MENKRMLIKVLYLQKFFDAYYSNQDQKKQVFEKFKNVWGETLAKHFLSKYDNAESLILALDAENLSLFVLEF